jgi:8-oxo-dGTP diphosphatase
MGAADQGAGHTEGRWMVIPRTLCFVFHGADVLLMKRAPNKRVFPNRYNGVGGHIERDEDAYSGARREILEETGLRVDTLSLCAVYNIDSGQASGIMLFVFRAEASSREVVQGDEGTLHWIEPGQVMSLDLVEDIPYILPRVMNHRAGDEPVFVHVSYDAQDVMQMRFVPQ